MNFTNFSADWLNRWTGPGTSNTYPRVTFVDDNVNMKTVSDFLSRTEVLSACETPAWDTPFPKTSPKRSKSTGSDFMYQPKTC